MFSMRPSVGAPSIRVLCKWVGYHEPQTGTPFIRGAAQRSRRTCFLSFWRKGSKPLVPASVLGSLLGQTPEPLPTIEEDAGEGPCPHERGGTRLASSFVARCLCFHRPCRPLLSSRSSGAGTRRGSGSARASRGAARHAIHASRCAIHASRHAIHASRPAYFRMATAIQRAIADRFRLARKVQGG